MCLLREADTERAVGLLRQYQANLTSPQEQPLKTSVGKVSAILGSQLFKALLGKNNIVNLPVSGVFCVSQLPFYRGEPSFESGDFFTPRTVLTLHHPVVSVYLVLGYRASQDGDRVRLY